MEKGYIPKGNSYRILNDDELLSEAMFKVNMTIKKCISESINSLPSVENALRQRIPVEYQTYKLITRRGGNSRFDLAREVAFDRVWLNGGRFYSH